MLSVGVGVGQRIRDFFVDVLHKSTFTYLLTWPITHAYRNEKERRGVGSGCVVLFTG